MGKNAPPPPSPKGNKVPPIQKLRKKFEIFSAPGYKIWKNNVLTPTKKLFVGGEGGGGEEGYTFFIYKLSKIKKNAPKVSNLLNNF